MKLSTLFCLTLACSLAAACTWETYQTENGGTALRQKYPNGTGVYYTNGAASQNTHYHESRPVQHSIPPK